MSKVSRFRVVTGQMGFRAFVFEGKNLTTRRGGGSAETKPQDNAWESPKNTLKL